MKKRAIIIFMYFIICSLITAQTDNDNIDRGILKFGISIESSVLVTTKQFVSSKKEEESSDIYPVNLYFNGIYFFSNNFGFEFKPGWVLGGEPFTAIELGFYLRYYFLKQKYFGKIGINIHKNLPVGHGVFSSTNKSVLLLGIISGYKIVPKFSLSAGYYYPLNNYPFYTDMSNNDLFTAHLDHLFRIGIEYKF